VSRDLEFAHALADAADAITLARFRALDLRVDTKPDLSPVSDADRAAEEVVRGLVASSGRGEEVFGEEAGGSESGASRWIVDPIDGTKSYVRGSPVWSTMLALERDGEVCCSVVSAPALGRRWWAERGGGAFVDGSRVQVSAVARVEDAAVSITDPAWRSPRAWMALAERAWSARCFPDFWQYCLLAEGAVDVACDQAMALWDFAPVRLIVEEAGGRCSTFAGGKPAAGESFVASNGLVHEEAVAVLSGTSV
jgi:histidinol-phosphatase